jgi:Ca-activated chloride channel family protein
MVRCLIIVLLFSIVIVSPAQEPVDRSRPLTVNVQLVQLPISVIDNHGLPIAGLQKEHFTVYEDKVPQTISLFSQEDTPASVALVLDVSGSMSDKTQLLDAAARTFLSASNPQNETAVVAFGEEATLQQDFVHGPINLSEVLRDLPPERGTAFYDAIYFSVKHLERSGSHERKVLLVITDGDDNRSQYDLTQVLKSIGNAQVTVYTIGLLDESPYGYDTETAMAKKALKEIAKVTGGMSFFPNGAKQVEAVASGIARDLRTQYTIGYRPSNENLDGAWRKVVVQINPPKHTPHFTIRTKPGYYAPTARSVYAGNR